jgi:hypothetical protein
MITLVQFETPAGNPVYLNPDAVLSIANAPNSTGQAVVEVSLPSGSVKVKGTLDSVARRLCHPEIEPA